MQYLPFDRFFVLMATKGDHRFKEAERDNLLDIRRVPIKFFGFFRFAMHVGLSTRANSRPANITATDI